MHSKFRPIGAFIATRPQSQTFVNRHFAEEPTESFIWFRLRQMCDVPSIGMSLFTGTLAERRALYRDFRAFMRQAQTYWHAATSTSGSAAALPYYYAQLQLAKAELLQTNGPEIQKGSIMHGLRKLRSGTASIKSDYLEVTKGVFPLLFRKRTGRDIPPGTKINAFNLLSLIPEISLEMQDVGPSRPSAQPGYYAIAMDDERAWSVVLSNSSLTSDVRERMYRRFISGYEEVPQPEFVNWRGVFAVSSRMFGGSVRLFQSRKTVSTRQPDGTLKPAMYEAIPQLSDLMGDYLRPPTKGRTDFVLTPTVKKSDTLTVPLDLVRYAAMFYLSSLVRYSPSALDPVTEGAQAYLMDSFANEVPLGLLLGALDGITGKFSYFDPGDMRL
ncbi:YaaC family protein [Agromyces sp. NPDC058126]|uniref:YaaC family protein n=1 Tax=Agromyces sp. NPDC058126 TaxID=3346350 RepID=UPI0036DA06F9